MRRAGPGLIRPCRGDTLAGCAAVRPSTAPRSRSPLAAELSVEHEFLERFALWRPAADASLAMCYLDAFAGGRPGVSAAGAVRVAARWIAAAGDAGGALLLDDDPAQVMQIAAALRAWDPAVHVRVLDAPATPEQGGITVAPAAFVKAVDLLRSGLAAAHRALVWIDAPSPESAPFASVAAVILSGADVLVRFPDEWFRRLGGWPGVPLADLPPHVRRAVEACSQMLGDTRHAWAFAWRAAEAGGGPEPAVRAAAATLRDVYAAAAPAAVVRVISLEPAGAGAPTRLVLSTSSAERALEADRIVYRMRQAGRLAWPEPDAGRADAPLVRFPPCAELELFDAGAVRRTRVLDRAALGALVMDRFSGRAVPLGEVMRELVGTEVFPEEVRQALSALRREGRARYRSLRSAAEPVEILAEPDAAAAGRGARRPRAAGADLFGGAE
jgi:hypothetical protein